MSLQIDQVWVLGGSGGLFIGTGSDPSSIHSSVHVGRTTVGVRSVFADIAYSTVSRSMLAIYFRDSTSDLFIDGWANWKCS